MKAGCCLWISAEDSEIMIVAIFIFAILQHLPQIESFTNVSRILPSP